VKNTNRFRKNENFQCSHCHSFVSSNPMIAGVQNRNHCPYCLWSCHVDLSEAGDRLAVCKGMMKPIGLTLKRTRKKYGMAQYGELMLIHQCEDCGRLSVNRIAADDDVNMIFDLYKTALQMDPQRKSELEASEIYSLGEKEEAIVRAQLFGKS
jgi:hypothetical protein